MARRRTSNAALRQRRLAESRPIDKLAAKVTGIGRKRSRKDQLIEKAKATGDCDEKQKLLDELKRIELRKMSRLTSLAAKERAKRALERARWKHTQ